MNSTFSILGHIWSDRSKRSHLKSLFFLLAKKGLFLFYDFRVPSFVKNVSVLILGQDLMQTIGIWREINSFLVRKIYLFLLYWAIMSFEIQLWYWSTGDKDDINILLVCWFTVLPGLWIKDALVSVLLSRTPSSFIQIFLCQFDHMVFLNPDPRCLLCAGGNNVWSVRSKQSTKANSREHMELWDMIARGHRQQLFIPIKMKAPLPHILLD